MRDLAKALLISAAIFSSVSAVPKLEIPPYFVPPPIMKAVVKEADFLSVNLTGKFHVDFRYEISDGTEVVAHYQATENDGKWLVLTQSGDYEIRAKDTK